MTYDFELSDTIPAQPRQVYDAWMSSEGHSAMTGAEAEVDPSIGGAFEAWDGYITGATLELVPGQLIRQSWRTADFGEEDEDSTIEVTFEPDGAGTLVTIRHRDVPSDQRDYEEGGWQDNYFEPMKAYFSSRP